MNYNFAYRGRNVGLIYMHKGPRWGIGGGLTYHLNDLNKIPYHTYIKNCGYAESTGQHFGLQFNLGYTLYSNKYMKFGLYYQNQFSILSEKFLSDYTFDPSTQNSVISYGHQTTFGPSFGSDNIIGLSIESKLTDQFYLHLQGGAGMLFSKPISGSYPVYNLTNRMGYSFTSTVNLGIGYTFNRDRKSSFESKPKL